MYTRALFYFERPLRDLVVKCQDLQVTNPATGEEIARVPDGTDADVDALLDCGLPTLNPKP